MFVVYRKRLKKKNIRLGLRKSKTTFIWPVRRYWNQVLWTGSIIRFQIQENFPEKKKQYTRGKKYGTHQSSCLLQNWLRWRQYCIIVYAHCIRGRPSWWTVTTRPAGTRNRANDGSDYTRPPRAYILLYATMINVWSQISRQPTARLEGKGSWQCELKKKFALCTCIAKLCMFFKICL